MGSPIEALATFVECSKPVAEGRSDVVEQDEEEDEVEEDCSKASNFENMYFERVVCVDLFVVLVAPLYFGDCAPLVLGHYYACWQVIDHVMQDCHVMGYYK